MGKIDVRVIGIGIVSSLLMDSKHPIMHWAFALDINFNGSCGVWSLCKIGKK